MAAAVTLAAVSPRNVCQRRVPGAATRLRRVVISLRSWRATCSANENGLQTDDGEAMTWANALPGT